jgi:hypothetical protein
MTLPCQPVVRLRLGTGASFGNVFVLGDAINGILGTNILGTTTSQIVDITTDVTNISIRRGRDRIFEHYTPGTATISWWDFTGDWNPDNTTSPYFGQILPMRQVKITTDYLGVEYALFSGFISSWDWDWPKGTDFAKVTIQADDGFRLLALSNVNNVTGAATGDLPGERINQILDMVDWPADMRTIDTGSQELQNDPGGLRSTLDAIQTVESTELGGFYMDGNGNATFKSRQAISQQASGTATTFADNGTGIDYQELDVAFDETELSNVVSVTNHGGTAQIASDATSIADYFTRTYTLTELLGRNNAQALNIANLILNYRKNPRIRIQSLTLDLSSNSDRVLPALSLDFGDPIFVVRTQSPTSVLDLRITVQGIEHTITPATWVTRLITREPLSTAFILGSTQYGILGTNTL